MPNLVNEIMLDDLQKDFRSMGSCLVVSFDKLQPEQDLEVRSRMREVGVRYRVVRNRLAQKALAALDLDLKPAFRGKCAVAIAPKEEAIAAAKSLADYLRRQKAPPLQIVGGVIEGTAYTGEAAAAIADLPDRHTVQTMLASAISGPARSLACAVSAVAGGLARCIQARIDKAGEGASS